MSLRDLKEEIENMSKYHQVEVLRLLHKNNSVTLNENQNGTLLILLLAVKKLFLLYIITAIM